MAVTFVGCAMPLGALHDSWEPIVTLLLRNKTHCIYRKKKSKGWLIKGVAPGNSFRLGPQAASMPNLSSPYVVEVLFLCRGGSVGRNQVET